MSKPVISKGEVRVIKLVAQGYKNKEVAKILGLSVRTVETHRAHITRKLGLSNVVMLVHYAIGHGLCEVMNIE